MLNVISQNISPEEYRRLQEQRRNMISINRSRRMKGQPPLPVPEMPEAPFGFEVYVDNTFEGFINTQDQNEALQQAVEATGMPAEKITLRKKAI